MKPIQCHFVPFSKIIPSKASILKALMDIPFRANLKGFAERNHSSKYHFCPQFGMSLNETLNTNSTTLKNYHGKFCLF